MELAWKAAEEGGSRNASHNPSGLDVGDVRSQFGASRNSRPQPFKTGCGGRCHSLEIPGMQVTTLQDWMWEMSQFGDVRNAGCNPHDCHRRGKFHNLELPGTRVTSVCSGLDVCRCQNFLDLPGMHLPGSHNPHDCMVAGRVFHTTDLQVAVQDCSGH